MCSARGCQHGHQRIEIMNDCVRGTIWDGYAPLLGQLSAETPHLHCVAVPDVTDDEAEGRVRAQDHVAPPGV